LEKPCFLAEGKPGGVKLIFSDRFMPSLINVQEKALTMKKFHQFYHFIPKVNYLIGKNL
jgi:hypothetical protein